MPSPPNAAGLDVPGQRSQARERRGGSEMEIEMDSTRKTVSGSKIIGKIIHEGPKAVVFDGTYREIWLKNANGLLTERHSHGYIGDGWSHYFRAVCGSVE